MHKKLRGALCGCASLLVLGLATTPTQAEQQVFRFFVNKPPPGHTGSGSSYFGPGCDRLSGGQPGCMTFNTTSSNAGALSEASSTGHGTQGAVLVNSQLNDAFDGYGSLTGGTLGRAGSPNAPLDSGSGHLAFDGLTVTRQVEVTLGNPDADNLTGATGISSAFTAAGVPNAARFIETFTNNTATTIDTIVSYENNLGSDSNTHYFTVDPNNMFLTSQQFNNGCGVSHCASDPTITAVLGNNAFTLNNLTPYYALGDDNPEYAYHLIVAPGQTVRIVTFAVLTGDVNRGDGVDADFDGIEDAITSDVALGATLAGLITNNGGTISNSSPFFSGLTAAELQTVLNFNFAAPTIDLSQPFFTENDAAAQAMPSIFDGGTLKPTMAHTFTQDFTVHATNGVIDDSNGNVTLSGTISGPGGLTIQGLNTATFSGNNTYQGDTTVASGTFAVGSNTAAGTGTIVLAGGATLAAAADGLNVGNAITTGGVGTVDTGTNTLALSGVVSGAGSITKAGTGTLSLTNANTYGGGTTVSAGTLALGSNTAAGTGTIALAGGTTLAATASNLNIANAITTAGMGTIDTGNLFIILAGAITGGGSITKTGAGILALTGANTYSGGTTISAGTLSIGLNTASGSVTGDIVNNGGSAGVAGLVFDRIDTTTFAGQISGTGQVGFAGGGTTTLSHANTYAGGTYITNAGTVLVVSADNNLGAVAGALQINKGTTFRTTASFSTARSIILGGFGGPSTIDTGANTLTLSGVISDPGTVGNLVKVGAGSLVLSGTNTYTGTTTVSGGTLAVNGSIASSSGVTVASGATLQGTGTVGSTTVASGGTIAPGNASIGTLHVSGNLALSAGSTYAFGSTAAASDLIAATGTASVGGTLAAAPTGGGYAYNQHITVVSSTGALSGVFSSLTGASSFGANKIAVLGYDAHSAFLTLQALSISPLLPAGASVNDVNVTAAIDYAMAHDGAGAIFSPLASLSPDGLKTTLDEMTGESSTAPTGAAVNNVGSFLQLLLDPASHSGSVGRTSMALASLQNKPLQSYQVAALAGPASDGPSNMAAPSGRGYSFWGAFYGGVGNLQGNAILGSHDTDTDNSGVAVGAEYRPAGGSTVIGGAFAGGQSHWNVATGMDRGHFQSQQLALYGSHDFGPAYLSGALDIAAFEVKGTRQVVFGGTNVYANRFDAWSQAARAEFGWRLDQGDGLGLAPYLSLQAVSYHTPNYAETTLAGSSLFALTYTHKTYGDVTQELGVQVDDHLQSDGRIDLRARLAWLHDYDAGLDRIASFGAFDNTSFIVHGAATPSDAARVSLGAEANLSGGISLSLRGLADLSSSAQNYTANAAISYRW